MGIKKATKSDVMWNYIGTFVSMTSSFVLLPILMYFLSEDELGLWYVYVAIANLASLFEFGFDPTFARNIVYVLSGATDLSKKGSEFLQVRDVVDWHLLNVVIKASKLIYAGIALCVLLGLITIGSFYVKGVAYGILNASTWGSWALFCLAVFLNIYFLWSLTVLRGYGDVAGENRARTYAKVMQLIVSALFLFLGMGLFGAALGYFANSITLRILSIVYLNGHKEIENNRKKDVRRVKLNEVKMALGAVGHVALRDGVVSFANYASTQAITLISSAYLGLAASGVYSIALQLSTAVINLASAYPKSFFPSMQAAVARADASMERHYVSSGVVAYWILYLIGTAGVMLFVIPLLPLLKPGTQIDAVLFVCLNLYMGLWNQHGLFCNYIVSMNEIPYMTAYLISAVLGVALSCIFCGPMRLGAWGIVVGQALSQLIYNNWFWPCYLCKKIGTSYTSCILEGSAYWKKRLFS